MNAKADRDGLGPGGQRARRHIAGAPTLRWPTSGRIHLPRSQFQLASWSSWTSRRPPWASRRPRKVEELIRKLRDDGHAVLLISHNFEQVLRLSDHVWVMRAGRCVGGPSHRRHRRAKRSSV